VGGKTTQSSRQVRQDDTANETFVTASEEPDDGGSTELAFYAGFRVEHRHVITAVVQRRQRRPAFTQSRPDRPRWKEAMDQEIPTWSRAGMWETTSRQTGQAVGLSSHGIDYLDSTHFPTSHQGP
jgi:hypothetical protein